MKRTAKIMTLAVALFAGFGASNAQAEGFKVGADVVSSYVWRGSDLGDSPAIQPNLSYTFKNGVVLGAWGSYAVNDEYVMADGSKENYKEVDLYVTLPVGPFSFTVTDYLNATDSELDAFDFTASGPNVLEASVGYTAGDLSLLAAINIAGADKDNAKYCEAAYKFYDKDGYTAKGVVGLGNEDFYGDKTAESNDTIALVNTGISVSKDRYTGSFIYNPDTEKSNLVIMASF